MLEDIIKDRRRKLEKYRQVADPYPAVAGRTATIAGLLKTKKSAALAGRILAWRDQGKIIFGDLRDESGKIQIVLNGEETENFSLLKETVDVGDFLGVRGKFFKTKRGEASVLVGQAWLLAKGLRPLPGQWYGLEDVESRLRRRYLDILLHPEVKEIFLKKAVFWDNVRSFLKKDGFLEVETPALEALPGGADAEPFATHHNALNEDFYLRISLELPLKKLLVAGYEKVFEIGRIFRNEGIDREHLQDYTQMECYAAYWDYRAMMVFVEKMYRTVIKKTFGGLKTKAGGRTVDWSKRWPLVDYYEVFKKETGLDLKKAGREELFQKAAALGLKPDGKLGRGRLIDLIFKKAARPKLWEPCFLINPPIEVSPLAKRKADEPERAERFQVVAAGTEIGNGFSELNDPLDQRTRFEEQMKLRAAGDKEAQRLDEDFLEALEYGMPPAAGFGLSERLFSVLVDKPIRESVIFPLMRKEK